MAGDEDTPFDPEAEIQDAVRSSIEMRVMSPRVREIVVRTMQQKGFINWDKSTLSKITTGKRKVTLAESIALGEVLGFSPYSLAIRTAEAVDLRDEARESWTALVSALQRLIPTMEFVNFQRVRFLQANGILKHRGEKPFTPTQMKAWLKFSDLASHANIEVWHKRESELLVELERLKTILETPDSTPMLPGERKVADEEVMKRRAEHESMSLADLDERFAEIRDPYRKFFQSSP